MLSTSFFHMETKQFARQIGLRTRFSPTSLPRRCREWTRTMSDERLVKACTQQTRVEHLVSSIL